MFSTEQLKRHAITLAGQHKINPRPGRDRLLPRLDENEHILQAAYDVVTTAASPGQRLIPAESWLLDNFYLIEQQIVLARRHLPRGYSRQLPRLADGPSAGFPRIYDLALQLISHMDGRVDNENATQIIEAYQTIESLRLGELWAFPIMLQLALLENLRRVALRIARRREERESAIIWADRMLETAEKEPKQLIQLLAEFANADVPLTAPFVEEFYVRLQAHSTAMTFVQTWLEQKLLEQGVTATQLSEAASRTAAANQISISNSIGSLRFIDTMDWRNYVESLSVVEQVLRQDPSAMYLAQDFATRDRYRHVIEEVARDSNCSELAVAHEAIVLAQKAKTQLTVNVTNVHDQAMQARAVHVGYYLIDRGRQVLECTVGFQVSWKLRASRICNNYRLSLYLGSVFLLTLTVTLVILFYFNQWYLNGSGLENWRYWVFAIPCMISFSALVISLVNLFITSVLPPRVLPRLDFSKGIPLVHRSMVIVPTLISTPQEVQELIETLEIRYLGNRDPNLFFALLTDFRDAQECVQPEDEALIAQARAAIELLNETYQEDRPCIFYFIHRPRVWNAHEQVWMGYERKRGKLEQFNAMLEGGEQDAFSQIVGDTSIFSSIKYVITLDTDTQLPRDTARTLIGNMAHPLNRPVYDAERGRIVEGYAILQPRASISLISAGQSLFTKLFAGESGIDPYTREVSDVYQDVFGEGTFIGKGIYDVNAFRQAVDGRFPENLILSHDLLESAYARSALVTDVDFVEEFPASYTIDASRRHRWIRGDWQLAGWLLPSVPMASKPCESGKLAILKNKREQNPLTALSIWKIFDNLRRSLVPPSLLAVLLGGWLFAAGPVWIWTLLVLTIVFLPSLLGSTLELIRKPKERDWLVHVMATGKSAYHSVQVSTLTIVLLPYDTLICLDAIVCSGLRMLFTKRGLLLWHMPSYVSRNARSTLTDFFKEMWVAPALAVTMCVILAFNFTASQTVEFFTCVPVLLLWLLSPVIAWWISKPLAPLVADLSADQQVFIRTTARRTWRFFAEFVSSQENWLPPDNFQEYPAPVIASRTSPTNIGMSLLANLAAYDFGYITAGELLQLTENTLTTMEKLERYHGHFYNWYDTRTLAPLHPQYVSTVDSGNLAGSLLTLQAGLLELKNQPVLSVNACKGLHDTLLVLTEQFAVDADANHIENIKHIEEMLRSLAHLKYSTDNYTKIMTETSRLLAEIGSSGEALRLSLPLDIDMSSEPHYWVKSFNQQCQMILDDLKFMVFMPHHYNSIPTPLELATDKVSGIENLWLVGAAASISSNTNAIERLTIIDDLVARCHELAVMDFEFLYDTSCGLLTIGYDVGERRRDVSCYDLLASEARLASYLVIAQGQVPQKHWFSLGRLLTSYGGEVSLISWSGSMFEYLMPQLMMPSYANTLLDQTCKAVVMRQIDYGRQRGVPWGISESCYSATDMHQVYQYRAFGVPGLGFKRGLGDDLVIAPYASALALTVMPMEACRNLELLAASDFMGAYGFYEAIDYTPSRVPRGKSNAVVRSYMAHHQGMSFLAFSHVLHNQPMQRRFMSAPIIQATELLLQERVPKKGATLHPHAAEVRASARPAAEEAGAIMRVFSNPDTLIPEVHLLSNGRYHVMATNAGGGYTRWRDLAVTRWREDRTADNWGTFVYLRDSDNGRYWSTTYQPTLRKAEHYEAIFGQARAEYRLRDQSIEAHTEISVSPEDDVEIRRIKLSNLTSRTRRIEVTSYAEVVLALLSADLAHRSFSNLFVQTEILADRQAILCTRRRRTPGESVPWMFHLVVAPGARVSESSYETDRAKFIGRGRTAANPIAFDSNDFQIKRSNPLSNTEGSVLDPIVAIRRTVTLPPDDSATLQIISGVADTREEALALLDKYCDRHFVDRAFEMAWFQSQEVLRRINASESEAQIFGRLASAVIYANPILRASASLIARNQLGQSGLWRFGVSGDLPIVLVRISDISRIDLVKQALQAHYYWRMKGLVVDLIIFNDNFSGYRAVLHDQIMGLINTGPDAQITDKPGGVFLRRAEELSEEARVLFQTVARVVFTDTAGTLLEQAVRRLSEDRVMDRLPERIVDNSESWLKFAEATQQPLPVNERIFCNGLGGFTPDGREYVITLEPGQNTPAPWVNVIASPHIGTVVSESGGTYTWVENAHEFRLTPWHNDPLSDSSGEAMYIRDEETGKFWSPTPLPAHGKSGYVCRHGFGYSVFEHTENDIASEMFTYVAMDAAVKFVVVKLRNHSKYTRQISLTGYWELVLGELRHANMMHIVTETDPHTGAVFARNAYGKECANRIVFAHTNVLRSGHSQRSDTEINEPRLTVTGSRNEFIGRNGTLAKPAAMRRKRLSGKTGAALDPCAAIQSQFELQSGQEREVVFVFGAAKSVEEAQHFIHRFAGPVGARQALESVWEHWNRTLGMVQVETPDPALSLLTNGWLIYQTLSCRLWGRSGYYQSGGAYGFRDQLQDTMALMHAAPWLAREQLIRCAERQFPQGDVQHWWHPPNGQGVRTHFSDDYLWLAYATCRYVLATGDTGVLNESVHFLEGRELAPDEEAYYDQPQRSATAVSLYEHCVRSIKYGLRFGEHHLPLMGCGDWNDGMNLVGQHGKGESVWLAWFLYDNLKQFADLARNHGDEAFAAVCTLQSSLLLSNIETNAWDGAWYRRAYFDDGTPLGSSANAECQIDSISQSWAVISKGGDATRVQQAMAEVDKRLVLRDEKLIQLLTPPFDTSDLEPGYIKGYVPGVRENGGQYTHAAIWTTMAFAMMGDKVRAWELFDMLNPVNHGSTQADIECYKVEPYVMCADIYGAAPHTGRGGWTWYTGAAGWMYRLITETLLGIHLEVRQEGAYLRITPCIPAHWDMYKIHYHYRGTLYHITVNCMGEKSEHIIRVTLDGEVLNEDFSDSIHTASRPRDAIPLVDDHQEHYVEVDLN